MTASRDLTGVHHVRLPVADLARSYAFWRDVLGYERDFDFPGPDGPVEIKLPFVTDPDGHLISFYVKAR